MLQRIVSTQTHFCDEGDFAKGCNGVGTPFPYIFLVWERRLLENVAEIS